ncbi:MAG: right-handed parallel beta-helix repeat-containing protein [bacterium]
MSEHSGREPQRRRILKSLALGGLGAAGAHLLHSPHARAQADDPAAETGPLYTTRPTPRTDRVVVVDDADELQEAIDTLAIKDVKADPPKGGVVQLKPKVYEPRRPIMMGRGVWVRGCLPLDVRNQGGYHSILSGKHIPEGQDIVHFAHKFEDDLPESHRGYLSNVAVWGADRFVHGIFLGVTGNPQVESVAVSQCQGHGVYTRGTQSGHLRRLYITECGKHERGTYGLSVAGHVLEGVTFFRSTIIGSVFVKQGNRGTTTPIHVGNGGKLHIYQTDGRVGAACKHPDYPAIINEGTLFMRGCVVTTNLHVHAPGLLTRNNAGTEAYDCVFEKCDPNVLWGTKSGRFIGCAFLAANNWRNGGHGFLQADIGPKRSVLPEFANCEFSGNDGDGIHQLYDAANAWSALKFKGNKGYGYHNAGGGRPARIYGAQFRKNAKGPWRGPVQIDVQPAPKSHHWTNSHRGRLALEGDGETTRFTIENPLSEPPQHLALTPVSLAGLVDDAGIPILWSVPQSDRTAETFVIELSRPLPPGATAQFDYHATGATALF